MKRDFYNKFKPNNPPYHYNEVLSVLDELSDEVPNALELAERLKELVDKIKKRKETKKWLNSILCFPTAILIPLN